MATEVNADAEVGNAEAAAGVGARRTVSNQETVRMDQLTDVSQDEAANLKMLEQSSVWNQMDQRSASNALDFDQSIRNLAIQSLQNSVETANMVGKQAVRHGDIAINGHWNIDDRDAFLTILASRLSDIAKKE